MTIKDSRLRHFTLLAVLGLVGLFSCAHLDEDTHCRETAGAEAKDANCPPPFQRPASYRPGYMNGR